MLRRRIIGIILMVAAGGWLLQESIKPHEASVPPTMDGGKPLFAWLAFGFGALVVARDTYFKWRDDRRAERADLREEKPFHKQDAE